MRPRRKLTDVREIQILGDQEASIHLGSFPDDLIRFSVDTLILGRVGIMPKPRKNPHQSGGKILIEFDPHAATGTGGNGRSSSAEEAA